MRRLLVFLICLNCALPVAYLTFSKVAPTDAALGGAGGDAAQYVRMYRGAPLDQIPKPYRYRVLTPGLARLVPFLPAALTGGYEVSPDKIVMFRFAMVNVVGLAAAGLVVQMLCECLGFGAWEGLVGSLLFMTGFTVVNFGAAPMVDAWSFFFLAAAVLSVLRGWRAGLLLSVLVGMFARETTACVLVPIVSLADPARTRIRNVLLCLPGIAAYLVFRLVLRPTTTGWNYGLADTLGNLRATFGSARRLAWIVTDGGLAFGVLWILALAGWWSLVRRRQWRDPLFRLSLLVPVAIVIPILIYANIGRLFTLAFPAVIPLALLPIRRAFARAGAPPPVAG